MTQHLIPDLLPSTLSTSDSAKQRLQACAKAGLFKHAVAKELGGAGTDFSALCQAYKALGKNTHDPGLILAINAHVWGSIFPLLRFGSEFQKKEVLPKLISGDLLSGHAITEPQAGSDTQAMETRAVEHGDGFQLNGCKRYITNTPIADVLVIYAKHNDAISAFLVYADDPGVLFSSEHGVQGCITASMGDVLLDDCYIPANRLLGKPGAGNLMIHLALELERAFIFSGIAGVMQWQLNDVVHFARTRQVKGQPLSNFQAISHRIAEMKLRLDTVQLWVDKCANHCDRKKRITIESAATKWYASEAFLSSCLDTVHIFGSKGLEGEHVQLVQDAMAGRLFSGSTELQKNIIASMLGMKN
ncbi:MAG: acyl-CoA dehydrogenase family protein [Mariprofundaceae bacterium]|nr:acyl-CoA dehydrogenase family protein [Mariprofundaceae bacterium]